MTGMVGQNRCSLAAATVNRTEANGTLYVGGRYSRGDIIFILVRNMRKDYGLVRDPEDRWRSGVQYVQYWSILGILGARVYILTG